MNKAILITLVLMTIGVSCWVAFQAIGSYVDDAGVLHEPFALLPIGLIFIAAGMLTLPVAWLWRYLH